MKSVKSWKNAILIGAVMFANTVLAVTPAEDDEKVCKKPKFREFFPAPKSEVLPESEISFHVSRGADPHSIIAEAKAEKMAVSVRDRVNFLQVSAKLPASLREGFARLHVAAKAEDGGCLGQDGWLIKIKGEEKPATPAISQENK